VRTFSLGISPASLCSFALMSTMTRIASYLLVDSGSLPGASSERHENRQARRR